MIASPRHGHAHARPHLDPPERRGLAGRAGHPGRLGIIGVGYVGLVTAASFAQLGHEVTCLDVDRERIALLNGQQAPFFEPGLDGRLATHARRLSYTSEPHLLYSRAEIVFVCVDTPPQADGAADLSRVDAAIAAIPTWATPLLVMKSTVPVGTGNRILALLADAGRADIEYVANPEFLREGSALDDVARPDRIVIGGSERGAIDRVAALYAGTGAPLLRTDLATAEMIKYASNTFLATKISFINEVANLCDRLGADVEAVAQGMGLDHRIGESFLRAGLGYGGSCFGKDISALGQVSSAAGYEFAILEAVQAVNRRQRLVAVNKLERHLSDLRGATIALLGLAFKADTSDTRDAPSIDIARALARKGASVRAYDPVIAANVCSEAPGVLMAGTLAEAIGGADAAVIVTEWPEFQALLDPAMRESMRYPLLIDGRNLLDPDTARALGYLYDSIGRSGDPGTATRPQLAASLAA